MVKQMHCYICGSTTKPVQTHILSYAPLQYITVCHSCHKYLHGKQPKLLRIFQDHQPIIMGKGQFGRYNQKFVILPKKNPPDITLEKLQKHVENLQKRFPDKNFVLKKKKIGAQTYYVLTKKRYDKHGNLQKDTIPIWFDLEHGEYLIEEKTLQKQPKLANYVIMVTLGSLGISQSQYAGE